MIGGKSRTRSRRYLRCIALHADRFPVLRTAVKLGLTIRGHKARHRTLRLETGMDARRGRIAPQTVSHASPGWTRAGGAERSAAARSRRHSSGDIIVVVARVRHLYIPVQKMTMKRMHITCKYRDNVVTYRRFIHTYRRYILTTFCSLFALSILYRYGSIAVATRKDPESFPAAGHN